MSAATVARLALLLLAAASVVAIRGIAAAEHDPAEQPTKRLYAILFDIGPGYVEQAGARGQRGMQQHVEFITGLHADGVAPLAGALFDDDARTQVSGILYLVRAGSLEEAREIAMREPMVQNGVLELASVRPFLVGVGNDCLD